MTVKYYPIVSIITGQERNTLSEEFLNEIRAELGWELVPVKSVEELKEEELRFIFVQSGGSENAFLRIYDQISDKPCYILSTLHSNSLAASMEILSYMIDHGKKGAILHGDGKTVAKKLKALAQANEALKKLRGAKFGVIGDPSDWLIASMANEPVLKEKLGISLVNIPMSELEEEVAKQTYEPNRWTEELLSKGYDKEQMEKAFYVYGGFRRLVDKYGLHGVTVRCFDLLTSVFTTGCLGLAILNADGVYGGCEGDIPSLISMAILGDLTDKPVFLCNPSRIDTVNQEMVFAHCTLPINMPYTYELTTHYESGIGVAVAGSIPEGDMTIFKTSGDLSRHFVKKGTILANLREPSLCRSQIKIKLDDYSYFLTNPIHNHHLVVTGDEVEAVEEFFRLI